MSFYGNVKRWFDQQHQLVGSLPVPGAAVKSEAEMRADVEAILRSAIAAVDPEDLVSRTMLPRQGSIPSRGRVWVAAFGKAAVPMAHGLHKVLGTRIARGVLVVPPHTQSYIAPHFQAFYGGHPIPDAGSVAAAHAVRRLAREAGEDDTLICLVSGGGSSLLTLTPEDLPLDDVRRVTSLLLEAGVPIEELNCVRKHLDCLKGGQLAREAAPTRVLSLVLSDVAGDALDVVASGPLTPDPTRFDDAVGVLQRYDLWRQVPLAVRGHLDRGVCGEIEDTPQPGDPLFLRTTAVVVGNGETAAAAACAEAERRGYDAQLLTTGLAGEARAAGRFLAETAGILKRAQIEHAPPTCIVTTGEPSVIVRGDGQGGRSQELALGAALGIGGVPGVLIASMGSDGVDGPTDAAGAIATGSTLERGSRLGLDAEERLRRNDAYGFFDRLDDLIVSGPTGTNVGDIQIVLVA